MSDISITHHSNKVKEKEKKGQVAIAMKAMVVPFMYPPSTVVATASALILLLFLILGVLEIVGRNLQYSKFGGSASSARKITVSSRFGMFMLYFPAFLAGAASFWLFPGGDLRFLLLKSAITFHFFKRVFEVLFVHKYSGVMALDTMIIVTMCYLSLAASAIYMQHFSQGLPEPAIDLKYAGIVVFMIGLSGNFYHHYLLSKLRSGNGAKEYKIPKGGLFNLVICPHYLFEVIGFVGISLMSQSLYMYTVAIGCAFYLTSRSYVTRNWYLSKFEDFPKNVKAILPFVF